MTKTKVYVLTGVVTLILIAVNGIEEFFRGYSLEVGGALKYPYLPFPVYSQGPSIPGSESYLIWWGIVLSIFFWVIIFASIYKLIKGKRSNIDVVR